MNEKARWNNNLFERLLYNGGKVFLKQRYSFGKKTFWKFSSWKSLFLKLISTHSKRLMKKQDNGTKEHWKEKWPLLALFIYFETDIQVSIRPLLSLCVHIANRIPKFLFVSLKKIPNDDSLAEVNLGFVFIVTEKYWYLKL